ncbi:GFA family protein [Sedimentitalea todarodis]|uniref:GFA family protein n=1 Tax=Sedimentitalea todarodis TaxID=1631240 RepID=UPI0037434FCE
MGEVKFAIQCYCRDCQQISGGGHLPQIAVPTDQFAAEGKLRTYQTNSESGNVVEVAFCGECGSPLFKSTSKMPDVRFLCAGSLDDDLVNEPFQRVYEESRRVWDE